MFWFLTLLCAAATAAPFGKKSMQEALGSRQVDRGLVLPKGWMELELALDSKRSAAQRGLDGQPEPFAEGAHWSYSRLWLGFSNAFSSRTTLYMRIPFVRASMHPAGGSAVTTTAMGDVHTGIVYQHSSGKPLMMAWQLDLKSPSGVEWPGSLSSSPMGADSFLTGTGVTNLGLHGHAKARIGENYALRLSAGYIFKFAAIVGYVVEDGGFGNGMLDAGDEAVIQWWNGLQLKPGLCLEVQAAGSRRGAYRIGAPGEGIFAAKGSEILGPGIFADAGAAISWEHAENRALRAGVRHQVAGADTRTFATLGLEEFSPQPGTTAELRWSLRW